MKPDDNSSWEYKPDIPGAPDSKAAPSEDDKMPSAPARTSAGNSRSVSWTASEFIEHQREPSWYLMLVGAIAAFTGIVYLFTRDYFAAGVIVVVGIIVGVAAGQKPRQVRYELNNTGLAIGDKFYDYRSFKSFSLIREGAMDSINLYPLKRFMPPISAYFEAKDEKRITDTIGDHLPYEERQMDPVDKLSRRLKL